MNNFNDIRTLAGLGRGDLSYLDILKILRKFVLLTSIIRNGKKEVVCMVKASSHAFGVRAFTFCGCPYFCFGRKCPASCFPPVNSI